MDNTGLHGLEAKPADYKGGQPLKWQDAITAASSYGSGWRLPTKDELNLLYQQKTIVKGFSNNFYWSSTEYEYDAKFAWPQGFYDGEQYIGLKDAAKLLVRAVRTF